MESKEEAGGNVGEPCQEQAGSGPLSRRESLIGEVKRLKEDLRRERNERRRLFAALPEPVLLLESDSAIVVDANTAACRLYVYPRQELTGRRLPDFSTEPAEAARDLARCNTIGSSRIALQYHRDRQGRIFPCELAVSKLPSDDEEPLTCVTVHDISERVSVEEELRRNEARLALAIEASGSGFYEYSIDLSRGYISPRWAQNLGFEADEVPPVEQVFQWWADRLHPDDRERVLADHQDFIEGRKEIRHDSYRIRDKQGRWRHLRVNAIAVERDEQGKAKVVVGTEVDHTERVEANQALRASEERYRTLYNRTPAMMHSIGPDGRIVTVSDKWLEVMGYRREEVLGQPSFDFLTPDSRRLAERLVYPAFLKTGSFRDVPYQFVRKDGSVIDVLLSGVMESDEDGNMKRATAVFQDITDRKRTEEKLRSSEQRYRELADLLPLSVFECDAQGRVSFLNKAGNHYFGLSNEEIDAGLTIFELVTEGDRERARTNFGLRLSNEPTGGGEYRLLGRGGQVFPALIQSNVMIRDKSVVGVRGIVIDISDQKRAEEERRKLQEQVLHAQKLESLGVLGGGIAHDFNNLLMGILGNASLALAELPSSSPAQSRIEAIETTAQRAAELTSQLLAYSGKGKFVLRHLNLSEVAEEMTQLLHVSVSKKAVLRSDLDSHLPPIEADPAQIRQIVMNLITNASDALGPQGGSIRISTSLRQCSSSDLASPWLSQQPSAGSYVCLEVTDSGCGMGNETLKKIFDPFYSTKFTGRGLGLAAVLGIVRSHHASIQVESRPDRGTTFRILFPAQQAQASSQSAVEGRREGEDAASQECILVVDDDGSIRELAAHMLEKNGYAVLTAKGGSQAIDLYRRQGHSISLVLLDMTMPQMDGKQTFRELLKLDPEVRVVLSSGYNEESVGELMEEGLSGFLQKPYRPRDLLQTVRRALG
ncbi:MAG TPA: PAS domain S-box protein [Acidobacteriota bacterium]|nr:PAS domain S-box protein [Acidobacteriota bacterium]